MDVGSRAAVAARPTRPGGASDGVPLRAGPLLAAGSGHDVPKLARGVELLGHYRDSASIDTSYLARRRDGQVVHLSRLLYLVLSAVDGTRTTQEVGAWVSTDFGRTVSSANIEYLLTNKLAPLGLIAGDEEDSAAQFNGLLTVKVKHTLVPERAVQHLAVGFRPLFYPLIIAVVLAGVVAFDAWLVLFARRELSPAAVQLVRHPWLFLSVIGAVLLSGLFHECGHATACRYGGARPGLIGVGFYVVWPAFFTDVTDSYRLGRAGRIRTDLGGVYFNIIFILAAAGIYLVTGLAPLLVVILLVHIEMFRQLVPSLRLDGYYILSDIVGVPDLFGRVGPILVSLIPGRTIDPRIRNLKRWAQIVVTVWVLSVVPILVFSLTLAILLSPHIVATVAHALSGQWQLISTAFGRGDVPTGLVGVISAIMLALPLLGISYLLLSMSRFGARLTVAAVRKHRVENSGGSNDGSAKPSRASVVRSRITSFLEGKRVPTEGWQMVIFKASLVFAFLAQYAGIKWHPYIPSPTIRDLISQARRNLRTAASQTQAIVAVLNQKGGSGKSTDAASSSVVLAEATDEVVVLVDANQTKGSTASRVGVSETLTVRSGMRVLGDNFLHQQMIRVLGSHPTYRNVRVVDSDDAEQRRVGGPVEKKAFECFLRRLKTACHTLIIDCGNSLDSDMTLAAVEAAGVLRFVTVPWQENSDFDCRDTMNHFRALYPDKVANSLVVVSGHKKGEPGAEFYAEFFNHPVEQIVLIPYDAVFTPMKFSSSSLQPVRVVDQKNFAKVTLLANLEREIMTYRQAASTQPNNSGNIHAGT